ncbi:MAG: hypothetical protein U1E05_11745, partial [Patescibacteria group bacterium]|nr:hypothetical protein [Patescibacteria group bacterium]
MKLLLLVGHSDFGFPSSFDFRHSAFDFLGVNFRVFHIRPPTLTPWPVRFFSGRSGAAFEPRPHGA